MRGAARSGRHGCPIGSHPATGKGAGLNTDENAMPLCWAMNHHHEATARLCGRVRHGATTTQDDHARHGTTTTTPQRYSDETKKRSFGKTPHRFSQQ